MDKINMQNFIRVSRNKLIIIERKSDMNNSISFIDIGLVLSREIKDMNITSKLSLRVKSLIENIFNKNVVTNKKIGNLIAIKNIGILLEPDLKIDILHLFDKFSKTNTLFVKWEGEIINNNLFFLSKEKGKKINIKNLSHIVI